MPDAKTFLYPPSNRRLWVVPYIRGRLIFAQLAARAIYKKAFDMVLIDLPCFMNQSHWLDAPLASFPLVSSLLIKGEDEICSLYPLVPTDAACTAAWLARSRSLKFECVDPVIFNTLNKHIPPIPVPELRDEQIVSKKGPGSYFEPAWLQMDSLWQQETNSSMRSLIAHGEAVATRISDRVSAGRKVLFVCEYRLWWAVQKAHEVLPGSRAEGMQSSEGQQTRLCALLLEDPYLLWSAGLFDDYLVVNKRFQESLEAGNAASFDKYGILEDILAGYSRQENPLNWRQNSPDTLAALVRVIQSKTDSDDGKSSSHLRFLENARSCLGTETADLLARLLINYPMPTTADAAQNPPEFFEFAGETIIPCDKWFNLPDVFHVRPYGEPGRSDMEGAYPAVEDPGLVTWLYCVHPVLTRQEAKQLGKRFNDTRWAVELDYKLHTQACSLARQAVSRAEYVDLEGEDLGTHTPVVFIFCNGSQKPNKLTLVRDNNLTQRKLELEGPERLALANEPSPDFVYSLFATTQELESLFEAHVERELLTSLTILFSGTGMGVERYAEITKQPRRYQCRLKPQEDPSLKGFESSDLGLAWATKYAQQTVIAVAYPGWKPSQFVQNFAHQRRKRILTVPLDVLPQELAGRLSRLHFVSTALKAHPEHERIVARFVR